MMRELINLKICLLYYMKVMHKIIKLTTLVILLSSMIRFKNCSSVHMIYHGNIYIIRR